MKENLMQTTDRTLETLVLTDLIADEPVRQKTRIHKFTGKEKHFISLVEASLLTRRHRDKVGRGFVKGGYFGHLIYDKILAQEGCMGVRSYFAAYNDGTPTLVLVGVDQEGNDMLRGVLGADMLPCHTFCGKYNLLNSDLEDHLIPKRKNAVQFTGEENHSITIAEAMHFVRNFRKDKSADVIKGGYFSREIYEAILAQEGCVGIRNYFAENLDDTPTIVMVAVESNGDDMIQGVVGEDILLCPPFCSRSTAL